MDRKDVDVDDVEEFVERFFSLPPGPPHSSQLQIEGLQTPHDIFRLLGSILTHGIHHLYDGEVDWSTWGDKDTRTLKRYMHCLGWDVLIDATDYPDNCLEYTLGIPTGTGTTTHINFAPLALTDICT